MNHHRGHITAYIVNQDGRYMYRPSCTCNCLNPGDHGPYPTRAEAITAGAHAVINNTTGGDAA